jgi:site-specific DNA-methyltransferase (adenine-specific)
MINITNEDNMQLMARYPDKYFQLAIVDPPYGGNDAINLNNNNQNKITSSIKKEL